jgi:hypothetical protein
MIPRTQLFRHDPDHGVLGDCYRAVIASILNLELKAVPHFGAEATAAPTWDFQRRVDEFLAARGLVEIRMNFAAPDGLGPLLQVISAGCPGVCFILSGVANNGFGHAVVSCDGEIIHDSNPAKVGIAGPYPGYGFGVTFIGAAIAKRSETMPARRRRRAALR